MNEEEMDRYLSEPANTVKLLEDIQYELRKLATDYAEVTKTIKELDTRNSMLQMRLTRRIGTIKDRARQ